MCCHVSRCCSRQVVTFGGKSSLGWAKPLVKTVDDLPRPLRVNLDPVVRVGRVGLPGVPTVQRAVGVRRGLGQVRQQLARRLPMFLSGRAVVRASGRGVRSITIVRGRWGYNTAGVAEPGLGLAVGSFDTVRRLGAQRKD